MYLSRKGYSFNKEGNDELVEYYRKYLTVKPKVNPESPNSESVREFSIYKENSKKFYIPKSLGLKLYGMPEHNDMTNGIDCDKLIFNGTLRKEQEEPVNKFLEAARNENVQGGIISLQCAAGKCLGIDTPILMYDGTIKKVQHIVIGDILMGDDSTPRNVLSTCSGKEMMYRIISELGDSYIVNESHILSLKTSKKSKYGRENTIVDITVKDYLKLNHDEKDNLLGYKVPIDFEIREIYADPYTVGKWLGNEKYHLLNYYIPDIYKSNSKEIRMRLLSGIFDSECSKKEENYYKISFKNEKLIDDLIFISRSLGYNCYKSYDEVDNIFITELYNDNNLVSEINVEKLKVDDYYGFEIDGNRRFVLGDFTVTHNTVMGLNIICQIKKKTIIVCHKGFLINQWKERIEQFIPTARIGIIKAKIIDVEDKDIVIASLQSLAMKEYDKKIFENFGMSVFDECHHLSAEVFCRALSKVTTRVMLGLSATLNRADGLRKVFEWYIGSPVIETKKRSDSDMIIKMINFYETGDGKYGRELVMWNGKRNIPQMINSVCEFDIRTNMLIKELKELLQKEPDRLTLIISDRRGHLSAIEKELKLEIPNKTVGYYVGGMKDSELKQSETKDIMLGTYTMISEGFDVPRLNTLVLASPISSVEQSIGRIQRQKACDRKYTPYVIDIWDNYSLFKNQGYKRYNFYKKNNYEVTVKHIGTPIFEDKDKSKNKEVKKVQIIEDGDE